MSWDKMREQSRKVMAPFITRYLQERRGNGRVPFSKVLPRTYHSGNVSSRKALARLVFMVIPRDQANGKRKNIWLLS